MSNIELSQAVIEIGQHAAAAAFSGHETYLRRAISVLGVACKVDRTYIFEFDYTRDTMSNTTEWCADGITPEINRLQNLPMQSFPWSLQILESGDYVSIPDVAEMPDEAMAERELFELQGIKSLILVPIPALHGTCGFIGFDSVRHRRCWYKNDAMLLEIAAGFVSVAMCLRVNSRP